MPTFGKYIYHRVQYLTTINLYCTIFLKKIKSNTRGTNLYTNLYTKITHGNTHDNGDKIYRNDDNTSDKSRQLN